MADTPVEHVPTAESTPAPVDNPAGSPPAASESLTISVSESLSKLSKDDYRKWESGDDSVLLPKAEPKGANEPEPAPGKDTEPKLTVEERSKRDKERGDKRQHEYWRDRAVEEKTRRETFERENAELKKRLESAPSTTPKVETATDGSPIPPKKPRLSQFQTIEEYDAADEAYEEANRTYFRELAKYERDQWETARQTKETDARHAEQQVQQSKAYESRAESYAKVHPEYPETAKLFFEILQDASQGKGGYIDQFVLRSEMGPQMIDYFNANAKELDELMRSHPVDGLPRLGEIQAGLKSSLVKAPRPKEHTTAPPPVHLSDGRSQVVDDPAELARQQGDMATYERLQTEKELKAWGLWPR